jgi:hypothetical protein
VLLAAGAEACAGAPKAGAELLVLAPNRLGVDAAAGAAALAAPKPPAAPLAAPKPPPKPNDGALLAAGCEAAALAPPAQYTQVCLSAGVSSHACGHARHQSTHLQKRTRRPPRAQHHPQRRSLLSRELLRCRPPHQSRRRMLMRQRHLQEARKQHEEASLRGRAAGGCCGTAATSPQLHTPAAAVLPKLKPGHTREAGGVDSVCERERHQSLQQQQQLDQRQLNTHLHRSLPSGHLSSVDR